VEVVHVLRDHAVEETQPLQRDERPVAAGCAERIAA
jgi:hypothetical protein